MLRVAVVSLLVACYLLFLSGPSPEIGDITLPTPSPPRDGSAGSLSRLGLRPGALENRRSKNVAPSKKRSRTRDQEPPTKGFLYRTTQALREERDIDLAHFENALKQIFASAPDEDRAEDLLLPFQGTGIAKLRDVGARARAFKSYLEVWEDLHLHVLAKSAYGRDNLVQLIRDHHRELDLDGMSLSQALRAYENYRSFITNLGDLLFPWTAPYYADHMSLHASLYKAGRGIVLSAGTEQVPFLLASIPAMRELGCTLPIEIMYLGEEDISEEYREILEMIPGVITRDIKKMVRDAGWELAGWAAKPFAMLFSSFQEVIFIDADAIFFQNPESLFEDPQYVETGALFFKDRSLFPESKRRWLKQILPKPISKSAKSTRLWSGESGHMQESGVVVVDKWRHFVEMLLVTRMNGPDRDGDEDKDIVGIYDMVYGDKETFWLAWELLGNSNYAFHNGFRGSMGTVHYGPIVLETENEEEQPDVLNTTLADTHKSGGESARYKGVTSDPTKEQMKEDMSRAKDGSISTSGRSAPSSSASDDVPSTEITEEVAHRGKTVKALAGSSNLAAMKQASLSSDKMLVDEENEDEEDEDEKDEDEDDEDAAITKPTSKTPKTSRMPSRISKRSVLPPKEVPTNYTICAPQLLHMDGKGNPLWFNGWLARNKYKDPAQSEAGVFEVYNREPEMASKSDAWQVGINNMVCLTTDGVMMFKAKERKHLDSVIEIARTMNALAE